jgi:DnaJ-class molecular chaperone
MRQQQPLLPPEPTKMPYICPVCNGKGFEAITYYYMANVITCHTCNGSGIVWG